MNEPIPTVPETTPALKESEARIAVAVLFFPDKCTFWAHGILTKALEAGLSRNQVAVIRHGAFFRPLFSTTQIIVNRDARGQALEAIKSTLEELSLLELSTIAVYSAEATWVTIHGLGNGGVSFDKSFLRNEDIEAAKQEGKLASENSSFMWTAFLEEWKRTHADGPGDASTQ